jgi:hypothetical protein
VRLKEHRLNSNTRLFYNNTSKFSKCEGANTCKPPTLGVFSADLARIVEEVRFEQRVAQEQITIEKAVGKLVIASFKLPGVKQLIQLLTQMINSILYQLNCAVLVTASARFRGRGSTDLSLRRSLVGVFLRQRKLQRRNCWQLNYGLSAIAAVKVHDELEGSVPSNWLIAGVSSALGIRCTVFGLFSPSNARCRPGRLAAL